MQVNICEPAIVHLFFIALVRIWQHDHRLMKPISVIVVPFRLGKGVCEGATGLDQPAPVCYRVAKIAFGIVCNDVPGPVVAIPPAHIVLLYHITTIAAVG